jgi:hypothetical protein
MEKKKEFIKTNLKLKSNQNLKESLKKVKNSLKI